MRRHKELLASIATAMICVAAVVPATSFSVSASGIADGTLDTTFGVNGKVATNIGAQPSIDRAVNLAMQSDGKFIIAGDTNIGSSLDFSAVRYNADGTLDTTFGTGGKVTADFNNTGDNDFGRAVLVQSDGKILLVGHSEVTGSIDFAAVRFNTDGTLDNTFGTAGKVTADIGNNSSDQVMSAILQTDGKILIVGSSRVNNEWDFAIARFNTDGTLDNTFGTAGKTTTDLGTDDWGHSVAVQTDGKIVLAGYSWMTDHNDFAVLRYHTNGTLDNTFGTGGKVTTFIESSEAYSVMLQADGKILVSGVSYNNSTSYFAVVRYNTNGSLDNTFGTGGKVTTDFDNNRSEAMAITSQADGKIILAGTAYIGSTYAYAVARYNTNGSLDHTFGTGGKVTTVFNVASNAFSLALQADGRIIVAGTSDDDFLATRYYSAPPAGPVAPTTSTSSTSTSTSTTTTIATTTTTAASNPTSTQNAPALSVVIGLPLATRPLVANSALTIGQSLTVSYEGFTSGELVQLVVASTPQVIGSGYANASGFVTLTGALPRNLSVGKHTLAVYAPASKRGFRQPITVTSSQLPATGATNPSDTLLSAMYLIALGASLLVTRRRLVG
jgi:uncharacterized delta-60 repeat protein/LPXTG-motif cell wall-anchored protein